MAEEMEISATVTSTFTPQSLRSGLCSTTNYAVPWLVTKFTERSFSYAGPAAWNILPHELRAVATLNSFKHQLTTHYFNIAFNSNSFRHFFVWTNMNVVMHRCPYCKRCTINDLLQWWWWCLVSPGGRYISRMHCRTWQCVTGATVWCWLTSRLRSCRTYTSACRPWQQRVHPSFQLPRRWWRRQVARRAAAPSLSPSQRKTADSVRISHLSDRSEKLLPCSARFFELPYLGIISPSLAAVFVTPLFRQFNCQLLFHVSLNCCETRFDIIWNVVWCH